MAGSEDNFSFIEFPNDFTDGDQSKWPAAPYVKVLEGSPSDRLWRHKTGQALAATVGYADSHNYCIKKWPRGYALFSHPRPETVNNKREDFYLLGGPKKYRSSQEFAEHALWLLFSGQPPTYLTERLASLRTSGKPRKSRSSLAPSSQTDDHNWQSRVDTGSAGSDDDVLRLTDAMRTQKKPIPNRLSVQPRLAVVPVQDAGSTLFSPSREQLNHFHRRYRVGELVWCVVDPPLRGDTPSHMIDMWPGIVETHRIRKRLLPEDNTVLEIILFQVKLLGLADTFNLPQSNIYPYKAFAPRNDLITILQSLPPTSVDDLPRELYHFHQNLACLSIQHSDAEMEAPSDTFLQAAGPYSLALQNAAHVARLWGFVYPQIPREGWERWSNDNEIYFSGLWWGAELIYTGEMVSLVMNRTQLALHPSMTEFLPYPTTNDTSAVLLQVRRITAKRSPLRLDEKRRATVIGPLFELVSSASGVSTDPIDWTPKQSPPAAMAWKRLLPNNFEAHISIQLVAGRYYEDDIGDILRGDHLPPEIALALHGKAPGYFYGSTPVEYMNTRADMARFARRCGQEDLAKYWHGDK